MFLGYRLYLLWIFDMLLHDQSFYNLHTAFEDQTSLILNADRDIQYLPRNSTSSLSLRGFHKRCLQEPPLRLPDENPKQSYLSLCAGTHEPGTQVCGSPKDGRSSSLITSQVNAKAPCFVDSRREHVVAT